MGMIFEAHDDLTGDSIEIEVTGDRLEFHTTVEGQARTVALIEPGAALRLASTLLRALEPGAQDLK